MRAIQVTRFGGPEVLGIVDVPTPVPGAGDLLVRTEAIGINFIDTYFRTGVYSVDLPYVPGSEGSGVVVHIGADTTGFEIGQRVAWASAPSSYAEIVAVPAASAIAVPHDVPAAEAASTLLQGMTAHYLIESTYPAQRGDTVLVHAGAGGVGLILTQLANRKGVRVITTVSSDAKETLSRAAGADEVLRYGAHLSEQVRSLTGGDGVHAVFDGVGADTFDESLRSLRVRGMLALFGAASGAVPPVDPQRLNAGGSLFLTRPTLAHHIRDRAELEWRSGEILRAIGAGDLHVRVGSRYSLEDATAAHTDLEARKTTGSIVLIP